VSADADVLIHRYLEGTLDADGAAALEEALRRDPAVRRRLAEMAFDHLELRDIVRAETKPAGVRRAWPAWAVPLGAAAVLFVAAGAAILLPGSPAAPVPAGPTPAGEPKKDYRGFAGPVRLRVVSLTEASARMRVVEVPGSPGHALAGRTVAVVPGFTRGDEGDVGGPNKVHQAFLRKLDPGAELVLDLRHAGEDLFLIGELTKQQSAWAVPREGDRPREKRRDPVKKDRESDTKEGDR